MLGISFKKLIIFSSCIYSVSLLFACARIIIDGKTALPVIITVKSNSENIQTEIYRVSLKGGPRLLTKKDYINHNTITFQDISPTVYYKAIQIKLPNQQKNLLKSITVQIGENIFLFSQEKFTNGWRLISKSSDQSLYESPSYVCAPRSSLPFWNNAVNWDHNMSLIADSFINKLSMLLLILVIVAMRVRTVQKLILHVEKWIIQRSKNILYISILLSLVIVLYRTPFRIIPLTSGLDPSWIIALNWAKLQHLHWGNNIVFTYGPYYWLLYSDLLLNRASLISNFCVSTGVFAYGIGVYIYFALDKIRKQKLNIQIAIIILLIIVLFDYSFLDIVVLAPILLFTIDNHWSYTNRILPACLLLVLLSLCKYSYLALSLCIILLLTIKYLVKQEYIRSIQIVLTFSCSFFLLWIVAEQPFNDLLIYITRAYGIAQGYTESMGTVLWNETLSLSQNIIVNTLLLYVGILVIIGIVLLFIISVKQDDLWYKFLLTSPLIFLSFKEGFIRMDAGHADLFFSQLLLILITYLFYWQVNHPKNVWRIMISLFSILFVMVGSHIPIDYIPDLKNIFSANARIQSLNKSKLDLQKVYSLDSSFRQSIGNKSIDIIPYDIALAYGYDLKWKPRLIFQSYSVYTSTLDSLNAEHFIKARSPEQVLFSFNSIDNRYPLFDEPMVIRALINYYKVNKRYLSTYLLLDKNNLHDKPVIYSLNYSAQYHMNAPIPVPLKPRYYTYMYADLELTMLGKLLNFAFKIQPIFVEVNRNGSSIPERYRLIRQTAKDGLLVSSFAENFQQAVDILSGQAKSNVSSIKFIGNTWLYQPEIKATFRLEKQ